MINSIEKAVYQLANFYQTNGSALGASLVKLSTGKKINSPSDDVASWVQSQTLQTRYNAYERLRPDLVEWQDALSTAETAGASVESDLTRMQELIDMYNAADATVDEKAAYTSEYDILQTDVSKIITNTTFFGKDILNTVGSLATLTLTPENDTMDITLGVATDPTTVARGVGTIAAQEADVDTAISSVTSFLAKVSGYSRALSSQVNIVDSAMQNTQSAQSTITDTDTAAEMINYTNLGIRQQATMAMLAQANISKQSVLALYQFGHG